jgi:hypothetical protein
MLSHCVQHLRDIALKQQHADRDGRYAVPYLAMGTEADRPSGFAESDHRPAQCDIDEVAPTFVDWADGFDFLPLDVPRHQSTIDNSALINREYHRISGSTPAQTVNEKGNANQPRQAKPFDEGNRHREAGYRRHCCAEQNKAGDANLGEAPHEATPAGLANRLRSLDEITLD